MRAKDAGVQELREFFPQLPGAQQRERCQHCHLFYSLPEATRHVASVLTARESRRVHLVG